ncbi:MAG: cyclopropane-fatty-acyl-phospholipid synthase family protein, partial [Bauldia sp.]|nr:cyclopropane-fatty-acyl-phospholipid synthase family protein [Bauldia sp.]
MNVLMRQFLARTTLDGSLEIVDADGNLLRYGDGAGKPVRIRFTSHAAERAVTLDPDPKIGEEYMDGGYVVESGSLYDFLELAMSNVPPERLPWWTMAGAAMRYLMRRAHQFNPPSRARDNVHHHYDLDGRLYSLFLDDDLQYSCAYFEEGVTSLAEAQLAKKRHLAAKLDLRPGQRVLDIGSGWGGLGIYLAEHAGVDVTGVTLSDEQLAVSNRRAEERGLAERVRFLLKDYRHLEGTFDRIVSVGMFEHVGVNHYRAFFKKCRELLTSDGVMQLHSISRFGRPADTSAFIRQYIFPGGYIPAISEVMPYIERSGLLVTDIEILRLHYAKTLRLWRERFLAHREEVAAL